jgi:hypothetical protein
MTAIAFRANMGSNTQSVANATNTKIDLGATDFNVGGAFDPINVRFQPTVAGYYQVDLRVGWDSLPGGDNSGAFIYKNGVTISASFAPASTGSGSGMGAQISDLVFLNGSGDYLEMWGAQASGGNLNVTTDESYTHFSAFLVYETVTQPPARVC